MMHADIPDDFLAHSDIIDWQHPDISALARQLGGKQPSVEATAKACFEYVRDHIKHCRDYHLDTLTCRASDVLRHGTGYCYAKSHLLAALLRANGIPAGFCYQRLTLDNDQPPYCIHGLNAVHLPGNGWYRIDARGNNNEVNAAFTPPTEQLAFPVKTPGEIDFPQILSEPLPVIVQLLTHYSSVSETTSHLPNFTELESISGKVLMLDSLGASTA